MSSQADAFVEKLVAARQNKHPKKVGAAERDVGTLPKVEPPPGEDTIEVIGVGTFSADEYERELRRGGLAVVPPHVEARAEIVVSFGPQVGKLMLVSRVGGHEMFRMVSRKALNELLPVLRELADVKDWTRQNHRDWMSDESPHDPGE